MYVNYTGDEFLTHVKHMISEPINIRDVEINEKSEILVLQTCSHHWEHALYIITAVKVDYVF